MSASAFELLRRYYPHVLNYDDKHHESDWHSSERAVSFRAEQCALVLVDVWNTNEIGFERFDHIVQEKIVPVVAAFRRNDIVVVHAPSPPVAEKYPMHRFHPSKPEEWLFYHAEDGWPTDDMQRRVGEYAAYSLDIENTRAHRPTTEAEWYENYFIHEALLPLGTDRVVGDRRELHLLLRNEGIFHLFYAGFASNGCIQTRDYGIRTVSQLGYDVTLVRDCTSALETADSLATMEQTRTSVDTMEWWISTCLSSDLIADLR